MMPLPDNHYFGGDDEGGYVDWASARMIGKGGFAIVYCASLKHVSSVDLQPDTFGFVNRFPGVLQVVHRNFLRNPRMLFTNSSPLLQSDIPVCIRG